VLGEGALADTRLAPDEDDPPATGGRVLERRLELGELCDPSHERRLCCVRERELGDEIERSVLPQDLPLELPHPRPGLDAELLDEGAPCLLIPVEGVGLSS
jgi:hypothetical protein